MIDPHDIRVTSYLPQSGHGAGGMTVGLTTSGMVVHHIPSGLGISCDSERSQHANKEKALQLLTSLLLAIESEKHDFQDAVDTLWAEAPHIVPTPVVASKVQMIKDVRQKAGCGLKEAKEAVDLMGNVDDALKYLIGSTGYCRNGGDSCVCGGDLPAIREGCYNWQK